VVKIGRAKNNLAERLQYARRAYVLAPAPATFLLAHAEKVPTGTEHGVEQRVLKAIGRRNRFVWRNSTELFALSPQRMKMGRTSKEKSPPME
jgi:T5orf172 domain